MTFIEYATVQVNCPEYGVVMAAVPWAHHTSRFIDAFEEQVAWLCVHAGCGTIAELMYIDWKSVGSIYRRVCDWIDAEAPSRFDRLVRIGTDEISYRKGYKYMVVVLNHDTGCVIWCAKGYGKEVL